MGDRVEYRVVWQREGLSKRTKRYATRLAAERFSLIVQGRLIEAYPAINPDEIFCCGGHMCACRGMTYREHWESESKPYPPLIYGPIIEQREVGEWLAP